MRGNHSGFGRDRESGRFGGPADDRRTGCGFGHGNCGPFSQEGRSGGAGFEPRRTLYRARDGKIMGVCKGLARYFDVSVSHVRLAVILAAVFTAFWPVAAVYVFLGLIIKPEPVIMPQDSAEKDFYSAYVGSRTDAVSRLRAKFENVEKRIRRMEDVVTSKEFDWERRFQDHTR